MTNKLLFLIKHSLSKKYKSKWFLVVNIIIFIVIASLVNIDTIIKSFGGDFNNTKEFLIVDSTDNYDNFVSTYNSISNSLNISNKVSFQKYDDSIDKAKEIIKEHDKILIEINYDKDNYLSAKIISKKNIDTITYTILTNSLNSIKTNMALSKYNITEEIYASINKNIILETETLEKDDSNELIGSVVVPVILMPIFFLSIYLVQLIGAEINEEKSTKSMEIILTNVSPQTHFMAKVIASNIFILSEGLLLLIYGGIGLIIRFVINGNFIGEFSPEINEVISSINYSGVLHNIYLSLPIIIILLVLTLLAYSLTGGILASMTTNSEDYQQLQTPIVLISLIGFYLSMLASYFKGSIFIKIISYIPFISSLLSPSLYIMGEVSIYDLIISLLLVIGLIYLLLKYGMRIYKRGILDYSGTKLWQKMFKSVKGDKSWVLDFMYI